VYKDRVDLPGQSVQGPAARMYAIDLQNGLGGPVLRNHRRRLRPLTRLRHGLLGCWQRLAVRRQARVRGRFDLQAAYLRGVERGQLLRDDRGRLWRDARVRRGLSQGRLAV
jgi:hypothetical protein